MKKIFISSDHAGYKLKEDIKLFLKKKKYIKEIIVNSNLTYFDTNTSHHHHFFDETKKELIDLENDNVEPIQIKKTIPGKKIKSVEVLVRVDTDNYYQKQIDKNNSLKSKLK